MNILLHDSVVCVCVFMYGSVTESRWVNNRKLENRKVVGVHAKIVGE